MNVALYARVSTTRQAENGLSIPDQLRQMRNWCERHGHVVVKEYVEPGASATDDKRPVFQTMVNDALMKPALFEAVSHAAPSSSLASGRSLQEHINAVVSRFGKSSSRASLLMRAISTKAWLPPRWASAAE